ncbi:MAG TPA: hypothetical protein VIM69_10530 [Opitutaceae bacterium]
MTKYKEDHYYKQFDRYPEGVSRFEAVARHAAFLLNSLEDQKDKRREILVQIRNMLAEGKSPALIALMIQEHIQTEFDNDEDLPSFRRYYELSK